MNDDAPDILELIEALTGCAFCKCSACDLLSAPGDPCEHECTGKAGCRRDVEMLRATARIYRRTLADAGDVIRALRGDDGRVVELLRLGNALRAERETIDGLVRDLAAVTGSDQARRMSRRFLQRDRGDEPPAHFDEIPATEG